MTIIDVVGAQLHIEIDGSGPLLVLVPGAAGAGIAPAAIGVAERKAAGRGPTARFIMHDVHRLTDLGETFDTVLDSGLLHIFTNPDRDAYLRSVRSVLAPGGRMSVLCFSRWTPTTPKPCTDLGRFACPEQPAITWRSGGSSRPQHCGPV